MSRLENFLKILKTVGGIAFILLRGLEEYRKIQEARAYIEENKKKESTEKTKKEDIVEDNK